MSVINGIDYDRLAEIADQQRVPFHKLCERAEKGLPLRNLVHQDDEWVDYRGAANILNVKYNSLAGQLSQNCELEYWGIEWKTRSVSGAREGKRGCGVLFKRADLVIVRNIKTHAHLSLISALKVFQAMEQGRI